MSAARTRVAGPVIALALGAVLVGCSASPGHAVATRAPRTASSTPAIPAGNARIAGTSGSAGGATECTTLGIAVRDVANATGIPVTQVVDEPVQTAIAGQTLTNAAQGARGTCIFYDSSQTSTVLITKTDLADAAQPTTALAAVQGGYRLEKAGGAAPVWDSATAWHMTTSGSGNPTITGYVAGTGTIMWTFSVTGGSKDALATATTGIEGLLGRS